MIRLETVVVALEILNACVLFPCVVSDQSDFMALCMVLICIEFWSVNFLVFWLFFIFSVALFPLRSAYFICFQTVQCLYGTL